MHLLRMMSYDVDPEYDFTPKIPNCYDAFQKIAGQMKKLIPSEVPSGMGGKPDIHEAVVPSTISQNVFGYTVHESSFHKCWTMKEKEPNIWGEDTDLPECPSNYKALLQSGVRAAIEDLCLEMNHTILRSLLLVLADKGLMPTECGNFMADAGTLAHILSLFYILFEEGENDFVEGVHGILMEKGHPCLSRKYFPTVPRLLLAIQVKNVKSKQELELLNKIRTYQENHDWNSRSKILIKFYDLDGTDKDLIFDEEAGTILWSFGYGGVCHRNVCGIGERDLILRKVKTASAKEHRIILNCDHKLSINAPTNVGLMIRDNKALDLYVSSTDWQRSIFYGMDVEVLDNQAKGTQTTYSYCILNKESIGYLKEHHGIDVEYVERGRMYRVKVACTNDIRIRFYSLDLIDALSHSDYFAIRKDSENDPVAPYVSMQKVVPVSKGWMNVEFTLQFVKPVKLLDTTRKTYCSHMIPCSQYKDLSNMVRKEAETKLEEVPVGFGEVPALRIKTRIPVKMLEDNRIVFRMHLFSGTFYGTGTDFGSFQEMGILRTNNAVTWQFVLHVMKDAAHGTFQLCVESMYEYLEYGVLPWAPIPPNINQLIGPRPWISLSSYDEDRGLQLELVNRDNHQFVLGVKEGVSIKQWEEDKYKRPETPPFEIVVAQHMDFDDHMFLSVFCIKLPSGCLLHGEILSDSTEAIEIVSLELPEVAITTSCKFPVVRLGAANCSISDEYQPDGSFGGRTIHYEGLTVTAVNGVIKLPIMYGGKDTIRICIETEDVALNTTILVDLKTNVVPEPEEPNPPEENPDDKKEEGGNDTTPDEGDNKGDNTEGEGNKDPIGPPHIGEGEDEI